MRLKSHLSRWQENKLITPKQATDIAAFEQSRFHDMLQSGLKYSGLLSILLGVALIVAANWDLFGKYTRLGGHIALNTVVAYAIWRWRDNDKRTHWREGAVYLLCGLTLTLIALIGQTFQLQGDIAGLLLLWMGLITGMVFIIGQNMRIAALWVGGFIVTLLTNIAFYFEHMSRQPAFFSALAVAVLLPVGFWFIGHWRAVQRTNPSFAQTLIQTAIFSTIACAAAASFAYYDDHQRLLSSLLITVSDYYNYLSIIGVGFIAAIGAIYHFMPAARKNIGILSIGGLFTLLPYSLPIGGDIFAAAHFIILFVILAFAAYHLQHERLLGLCIILINIRLFIVFLELFGSMLMTGWGLIICGLILLGLMRFMRFTYRTLMQKRKGIS